MRGLSFPLDRKEGAFMLWVITGLFYGLFMSFYTYINQNNKVNGYVLGLWRGFGVAFACFPLVLITPFEWDIVFVFMLIVQGMMTGFYDSRIFFASARFGAAGTSRVLVLSILLSMVLWWTMHPEVFLSLWHRQFILLAILISVACAIASYVQMLKTPLTCELLRYMLPVVVVWSLMSSLTQMIMQRHLLFEGIVYYLFYVTLVSGFYNLYFYIKTERPTIEKAVQEIFNQKVMYIGLLIVLFSVLLIISKGIALDYTPNTGYVNALSLTAPLWIMLYDHVINHKDYTSPRAGLAMIISLFFLSIFANL